MASSLILFGDRCPLLWEQIRDPIENALLEAELELGMKYFTHTALLIRLVLVRLPPLETILRILRVNRKRSYCQALVPNPSPPSPQSPEVTSATLKACLGVLPVIVILGLREYSQNCYTMFVGVLPQKWSEKALGVLPYLQTCFSDHSCGSTPTKMV